MRKRGITIGVLVLLGFALGIFFKNMRVGLILGLLIGLLVGGLAQWKR